MKTLTTLAAAFALTLGATGTVLANDGTSYVRYETDANNAQNSALQTAVGHFTHPDHPGLELILYGVVHIADADYYARVQKDLDSYTTVLYEGVAPTKNYKPTEDDKSLGDMQKAMGSLLGLTFQKDGINYKAKNLVHADMNMDQLKKALGGGSINPMGGMMSKEQMKSMGPMMKMIGKFGKMFMEQMPGMQDRFKTMMAKQLGNADVAQSMPGNFGKVILIDRNEVVMKVLARELPKTKTGSIAIFYGAAHNPDFEQRLGKLGWTLNKKRWMTAWRIGEGLSSDPKVETPRKPAVKRAPEVEEEVPTPAPTKKSSKQRWF
jgi:hypothetical protein